MVLSAAEEVMSEKGLVESTISEIGRNISGAKKIYFFQSPGKK